MFTELYQHLTSCIESIKGGKGEAVIRWVDLQSGQLRGANLPPVSFPCALIAFDEVGNFEHHTLQPSSRGSASVEIELAFKINERTHSKNTTTQNVGLVHFAIMESVVASIHGTHGEAFDTLFLESIRPDTSRQDIRIFIIRYALNAFVTTTADPANPDGDWVQWNQLRSKKPDFCVHPKLK